MRPFEDAGIKTPDDVRALSLLRAAGSQGLTNSELLADLGGSKAGISSRLSRLAKYGNVVTVEPAKDRRYRRNTLTPSGEQLTDEILARVFDGRSRLFAPLEPEQVAAASALIEDVLHTIAPDD